MYPCVDFGSDSIEEEEKEIWSIENMREQAQRSPHNTISQFAIPNACSLPRPWNNQHLQLHPSQVL